RQYEEGDKSGPAARSRYNDFTPRHSSHGGGTIHGRKYDEKFPRRHGLKKAGRPGCCGAAARLPKKPGSQKLTPPSSAKALCGAETMVASANTASAAIGSIDRRRPNPNLLASRTARPSIVAPLEDQPSHKRSF